MSVQASPGADLARVVDALGDLLYSIADAQWWAPTPCKDWNVRDLVAHVVAGNRNFIEIVSGREPMTSIEGDLALPGPSLRVAYHLDLPSLLAVFDAPEALDIPVRMQIGTVPRLVALWARTTDLLVNGWDLARAIEASPEALPQDVATAMAHFVRSHRSALPIAFASARRAPLDASPIDRLAALLGRVL